MSRAGAAFSGSVGQCAMLACLIEATIAKPGNVHPGADFENLRYEDLLLSALAIGPIMDQAATRGIGELVLGSVEATQRWVRTNSNLGLIMLLAPLARAAAHGGFGQASVARQLAAMDRRDAELVYQGIRLARPGGLGTAARFDVGGDPPADLLTAMRAAEDRDMIARQYVRSFADVLEGPCAWVREGIHRGWNCAQAVLYAHVRCMATWPDSLIARKCGGETAREAATRAATVLRSGWPADSAFASATAELDAWLRRDGNRRNPGTTADLVGAGLFVLLWRGELAPGDVLSREPSRA